MTNDEKMLIQLMRDGSDKDFGLLVRHYGPTLMTFVGRIVVQQEDAEDVVQNTFVAAYEHRKGFDSQRASLTTWLQRIAYHEALHHLRRRKRQAVLSIDVGDDFPDELPTDTTAEQLDEAILRLTPEEQMLLQFYYFDQRPLKEIAYITVGGQGSKPNSVAKSMEGNDENSLDREVSRLTTQLHRIRQRLRIILTRMNDE